MCETAKEVALRKGQLTKSLKKVREQAIGTSWGVLGGTAQADGLANLKMLRERKGDQWDMRYTLYRTCKAIERTLDFVRSETESHWRVLS